MKLAHRSFDGPPSAPRLLLLHGVTRNWRDWEPLLPELTREWRVVALDHAGHGDSERANSYRVADYTRYVADFVRESFREPPVVFGHSLGAMVALGIAAECAIAGAVLEEPPYHTMGRGIGATPYRAQFAGMQEVAQCGGDLETMTDGLADIRISATQRLGDMRDRESLRFLAECVAMVDPEIFTPLVAGEWLEGFDHAALLSRVKCPVLLMQGDPACGGVFTDADADLAESALAQSRRVRFPSVGHQIHRTSPVHVGAVLRQWMRDFFSNQP